MVLSTSNMSKTLLLTRPNHDHLTTYLFYWCEHILKEAKEKSFKVLDLYSEKANYIKFNSYIKKHKPDLVIINGHGNNATVTGYNNEPIIAINKNDDILENTVAYIRSCQVASKLGEACIRKKAIAIIGYNRNFALPTSADRTTDPLKDNVAKLFIEPSNLIPISLIKGNTVKEAHIKSKKAMVSNFRFMISTKASQAQKDAAPYLWSNLKGQVILGDDSVKI